MAVTSKIFSPNRLKDYSKAAIIEEIQRVIRDECAGVTPARDEFERLARVSRPSIAKHFGTYREALRQAGVAPHKQAPRPKVGAEEVRCNLLEVLKRASGYCFSQGFYRTNGGTFCEETVKRRLGVKDWQAAMEAIGAEKRPHIVHTVVSARAQRRKMLANLTEAELFKEIDRVWQVKGRRPSYSEFNEASALGITVYLARYGSWTAAVEAFCTAKGILVQGLKRARPTNAILLNELRSVVSQRPGDILTYDSYKRHGGTYSSSVFVARFGSWTAAVNAVGSTSGKQGRFSRDELLDEIQRLWEVFGRQPKYGEMSRFGRICPDCYAKQFGSWTKAIHAFCEDRSGASSPCAAPLPTAFTNRKIAILTSSNPIPAIAPSDLPNRGHFSRTVEHGTGRSVSLKLRFKVLCRDRFTCKACGRSPASHPGLELQIDHVDPYSTGGETRIENLQTELSQVLSRLNGEM